MDKDEILKWIQKQVSLCGEENWYPDNDSKRHGYLEAMAEVYEWIKELK